MHSFKLVSTLLAGLLFATASHARKPAVTVPPVTKNQVELVFALDTTGSMGGLLDRAKEKIWFIASEVVRSQHQPDLRIGLVAYRDKGDRYITQIEPLSSDLDAVYEKLLSYRPEGGGDHPEHVNQALHDAVTKMQWSASPDVLKMVFLVGDAPPHMDYQDDIKHQDISRLAVRQNIYINTIQCGNHKQTARIWRTIAHNSEGRFASIPQNGGTRSVSTPYDMDLRRLAEELDGTFLGYGHAPVRTHKKNAKKRMAVTMRSAPAAAAADRAVAKGAIGFAEEDDLVSLYAKEGASGVMQVGAEELPNEIRDMTGAEREKHMKNLKTKREAIQSQIDQVSKKRGSFLKEESRKVSQADAFDVQVLRILKEQNAVQGS
jgi:hypothetical protein